MAATSETTRDDGVTTRRPVVVASGVQANDTRVSDTGERPVEDFMILGELFDATMVDPTVALRGRVARFADRLAGNSWPVAYRAVREADASGAVIIAMGDDVGVPLAAMKVALRSRAPLIVISQHLRSRKSFVFLRLLRLQRTVQLFFAMSYALRDILIREYHVPPEKIAMLFDTVDHRFFAMDPSIEERHQIVSAGMAARDYKILLDATRGLDVDVKIEAHSAWYTTPVNFAPEDVHERVELCDDGTTIGLRRLYAESAIVVVPLQDVDFAAGYTTILEGMSMSKPVIATRTQVHGDFIEDGRSGFYVPPEDVNALRERIVTLLADPELRATVGRAARARIEESFSRDIFRSKFAAAVERLATESR